MTEQSEKVRENRLRRWAERLGLKLSKSRARTFKVDDQGGWQVSDRDGEVLAGTRFELDLDSVEKLLKISQEWVVERSERIMETPNAGPVLVNEVRARHLYPDEFRERLMTKLRQGEADNE